MGKINLIIKEIDCPGSALKKACFEKKYYTYLLLCCDNSLYCGSTSNLKNRLKRHNDGEGAQWTKMRRPVKLVYFEFYNSLVSARRRELQIKGWTMKKKLNLILGVWGKPKNL